MLPEQAQEEVDRVLGGSAGGLPSVAQYGELKYLMRCVNESMRLYPHPPVLLRRAQVADTLPGAPIQASWMPAGSNRRALPLHARSQMLVAAHCRAPESKALVGACVRRLLRCM
jgi:hypothetical protein